jgi:hypothetical protein
MLGAFNPKCVEIFEEGLFEGSSEGRQRDACFAATADGLVVDIGEVHDAVNVEPAAFEMPLQEIFEDVGAEVSDVGEVVNGGSAGVEADGPAVGIQWGEGLERAGERVEEAQRHGGGDSTGWLEGIGEENGGNGERGNAFTASEEPHAFVGGGFDADAGGGDSERSGEVVTHGSQVRTDFWRFADEGGVDVHETSAPVGEEGYGV